MKTPYEVEKIAKHANPPPPVKVLWFPPMNTSATHFQTAHPTIHHTVHEVAHLPPLMRLERGEPVRDLADWQRRREELQHLLLTTLYGALPRVPERVQCEPLHHAKVARMPGVRKRSMRVRADGLGVCTLTLWLPPADGPLAVLLHGDACWSYATEAVQSAVLARGYALAEFNRTEVFSDHATPQPAQTTCDALAGQHVAAIAAWAWGFHRAIDALLQLPEVDAKRIAIVGHSRGGKAALLAGATDPRIAVTGANNSGAAGAGCFRVRNPGAETLTDLVHAFPHWLAPAARSYCGRDTELPIDQHFLKALIAPRALLCTEALGDAWANPHGTQHTHEAAAEVYRWLGVPERIAIQFREGGHSHTLQDWTAMLDFMDACFSA
jgi:dienelactone hydrolase